MRPFNATLSLARGPEEARARLEALRVDSDGLRHMAPKSRVVCVELEAVPAVDALAIKDEFLALGAEAAVSTEVYNHQARTTPMLLLATPDQFRRILPRIAQGTPGLARLAADLPALLEAADRREFRVPTPRGDLILGGQPLLMGILNCTPDSFFDGGRFFDVEAAVVRGLELLEDGADVIDVGGESTRPGADPVPAEEELRRVLPVIERLAGRALVSVDTQKPEVARRAVAAGAAMINDVGALRAPGMARAAAETGAAVVLMHMLGEPRTMQQHPVYTNLYPEVIAFLEDRVEAATAAGVDREKIIVDPGIGFGKTVGHNLELIRDLARLRTLGRPIMVGPSNKMFVGKVTGADLGDRTPGTGAAVTAATLAGAHIIRVHDVAAMRPFVEMGWAIKLGDTWSPQ